MKKKKPRAKKQYNKRTLLQRTPCVLPDGSHTQSNIFQTLVRGCAAGDRDAMWDLAEHFAQLYLATQEPFYDLAGTFWRSQALICNEERAKAWFEARRGMQLPAILDETRSCREQDGKLLYFLGYPAFQSGVCYDVHPILDYAGIALICIYPHDDGTFESAHYSFTYYDEYLNPLPIASTEFHPRCKPDMKTVKKAVCRLRVQAKLAALLRNNESRKNRTDLQVIRQVDLQD